VNRKLIVMTALLAGLVLALAGCGGDAPANPSGAERPASPSPTEPVQSPAVVSVAQSALGEVLVDAEGRTLYAFTKDSGDQSSCYGDCAATWPALVGRGVPAASAGVEATLVALTERRDGSAQVTYNGMPLYHFAGDQQPGDTNGQGVGGSWFMVAPDGALVRGAAQGGNEGYQSNDGGYGSP
jgi:predicted lipoprotein with Yx(FWY)xxD motif